MSNDTRGPQKGRIPPHIKERVERKAQKRAERVALGPWYRRPWFLITIAAIVALIAGVTLGRFTAPDPVARAADEAAEVIGVLDQSEIIWQGGTAQGAPPVNAALDELRTAGDTATIETSLEVWVTSYERLIGQLETAGVPAAADGVRRLALASTQLSKDATETLGAAATVDGEARELLLDEVDRLRARAEQYDASARRHLAGLRDEDADVPAPAASMPDLPRPTAAPAESPPAAEEPTPDVDPTADATEAEPSPDTS